MHCETCDGLGFIDLDDNCAADCRDCGGVQTHQPDHRYEPLWDAACVKCDGTGEVDIINPDWMGTMAGELGHDACSCRTRRVIEYNALCEACHRGRIGGNGLLCECASDVTMADLSRYDDAAQFGRLLALAKKLREGGDVTAARAKWAMACEFLVPIMRTGDVAAAEAAGRLAAAAKAVSV